jgi:GT2 family glycosyltransferase
MSEVAAVVLNYNGLGLLDQCLGNLARLTVPADVVLADNGSTDGSAEFVRQNYPSVRVLDLGQNLEFARGYNAALAQVPHAWVALVNNDAAVAPHWLERLLAHAAQHPRAGILGGKLLFQASAGQLPTFQSAGASFTEGGTGFEIGWGQPDQGQYDQARPVGAISGAAMLARHAVFDELGGFDAAYGAYLEDVDLCWRAWLRGYTVEYVPAAVASHRYGASGGGRASPYRIRLMQRNRLATALKNLAPASLPRALAVSLAYDAYRMLEYLARGQPSAVGALVRGTVDFWRDWRAALAARQVVQRGRVLSDQALREQGLLISTLAAFREYRRLGVTRQPPHAAASQP